MSLLNKRLPIFKAITGDSELNPKAKSFSKKRLPIFTQITSKLNPKAKPFTLKARGKKRKPTKKKRRSSKK